MKMVRGKSKLDLIEGESGWKASFLMRKKGIEKKAYELSTLCDVNIGIIMYTQHNPIQPIIWPPNNHDLIFSLIKSYTEQPQHERSYRSSNIVKFCEEKSRQLEEEVSKLRKQENELKYPTWDDSFESLSYDEIVRFGHQLEVIVNEVDGRIGLLKGTYGQYPQEAGTSNQAGPCRCSYMEMKQEHEDALMVLYRLAGQALEENQIIQGLGTYPDESMFFNSLEGDMQEKKTDFQVQAMGENPIMIQGFQTYPDESMFSKTLEGQMMQENDEFVVNGSTDYQGGLMAKEDGVGMIQRMIPYQGNSMGFNSLERHVQDINPHMKVGDHPPAANNIGFLDPNNFMSSPSYRYMGIGDELLNMVYPHNVFSFDQSLGVWATMNCEYLDNIFESASVV